MKVYEFGDRRNPVILLLPGTACHWKTNYGHVIEPLSRHFFVSCVSYDGFDETEDTVFTDMMSETEKIESYVKEHYQGIVHCVYGSSLGGSFMGLMAVREKIHMNYGILGSSDLDQSSKLSAHIQTALIVPLFMTLMNDKDTIMKKLTFKIMAKVLGGKDEDTKNYINAFVKLYLDSNLGKGYFKKESLKNQFYSDLITVLPDKINPKSTEVHVFYAEKMGTKYEDRYKKHFINPILHRQNMMHEELLFVHPEEWVKLVEKVCR